MGFRSNIGAAAREKLREDPRQHEEDRVHLGAAAVAAVVIIAGSVYTQIRDMQPTQANKAVSPTAEMTHSEECPDQGCNEEK